MRVIVRTNRVPRLLLDWDQLAAAEQSEFDYLSIDARKWCADFVRYRGVVYDVGEFQRVPRSLAANGRWDGYSPDTYFSGVVFRFADDDHVVMGTYYVTNGED